jgi:hypothetical protein
VFKSLDVAAFEKALGEWLAKTGLKPDDPLSVDGKSLRGIHGEQIPGVDLVSAYANQAEVVLSQMAAPGKGHELAAAKEVLEQAPLEGRVVMGDALLTQRDVCEQIVAGGGDYLLPVKDNQPTLHKDIEAAFSPSGADGSRTQGARLA